ncbi:hypothetical protein L535_0777 [Bordetella bronchiseptica SBL-F6116]|nr:hypothetical protein L489_0828 [Bordetella bronchiseptica 00-P-2730]KDC31595.1 hypothetical protein L505_0829 [Bordetella bronchiseptica F4563]KDD96068.1 hypothetical protein L535_0777 [Bordetella bronchiseptica SBL-F6116]
MCLSPLGQAHCRTPSTRRPRRYLSPPGQAPDARPQLPASPPTGACPRGDRHLMPTSQNFLTPTFPPPINTIGYL